MDYHDTPEEAAFRRKVREFVERECPPELRTPEGGEWGMLSGDVRPMIERRRRWRQKLLERGWIAPAWPKEYGGGGLSVKEQFILNEELAKARAPRFMDVGLGWVGPTLIIHGTEEQRRRYLRPILTGEEIWCQGFSEPNAGSDLANVQTRAVRQGDYYVVNGQKIWTSGAQHAHFMILLCRTDPNAPKHKGLSYLIVDMRSPGITVREMETMAGTRIFCQVFFEDVKVPVTNLVGEENRGWYVATTTLDFERSLVHLPVEYRQIVLSLIDYARRGTPPGLRPLVRAALADCLIETEVAYNLSLRVVSIQARGQVPNYEASIVKLYCSELEQRIAATGMRLLSAYGQLTGREDPWAPLAGRVGRMYLYAVAATIGGGTSEIQRNIIAVRGLGLPRG